MTQKEADNNSSLAHWVSKLHMTDHSSLAGEMFEDRAKGYKDVERLGLPRFRVSVFEPLARFFAPIPEHNIFTSEDHIARLNTKRHFVTIAPTRSDQKKYSALPLEGDEIVPFIHDQIPPENYEYYNLIIGEFRGSEYGGVIVVNPDEEKVYAEMVKGSSSILTRGGTPEYTVSRDPFTGFFHNSESLKQYDELRIAMHTAIASIPHRDSTNTEILPRHRRYKPGYYEFLLVEDEVKAILRPVFIDYKDNIKMQALQI